MKFSFPTAALLSVALAGLASSQLVGTLTPEVHPKLSWTKCTTAGGCVNQPASIVLDANWRWLHSTSGSTNCYDGNKWDPVLCPNETTCTANCAVDGADYTGTYGVTTSGNAITHKFVQKGQYSTNIGSRVYLMDSTDQKYQMFYLKNQEFTFDADVSNLVCGLNGALYFVEMEADGGLKHTTNKAGAKYGTGYCDAQCPHDIKYISGKANVDGWTGSATDPNAGTGKYGTCCPEMDIWEANKISTAYTPHACTHPAGPFRCEGVECGDGSDRYNGVCDKDGCDINPYRMGNLNFYGPGSGFTIDTTKKVTVVTQFITDTGTATGNLIEIRRKWIQNGIIYETPTHKVPNTTIPGNSISDAYCSAQKSAFGDTNDYAAKGNLKAMGDSLGRGHVLVMSIWADHAVQMRWLDSQWPLDKPASNPGVMRGTCPTEGSSPDSIVKNNPNSSVQFSNIRFGDIGSTFTGTPANPGSGTTTTTSTAGPTQTSSTKTSTTTSSKTSTTTTSTTAITSPTTSPGSIPKWQQCGGINWGGSGTCVAGSTCTVLNPYYSQCL